MEDEIRALVVQYAIQKNLTDYLNRLQPQYVQAEQAGEIQNILVPKTEEEILEWVAGLNFKKQNQYFKRRRSVRHLRKRLLAEYPLDEVSGAKWAVSLIAKLAETVGMIEAYSENCDEETRILLEEGLAVLGNQ